MVSANGEMAESVGKYESYYQRRNSKKSKGGRLF
jgi:hypothetical protein